MNNLAIFEEENVKVKTDVVRYIKGMVKDGFYKKSEKIQRNEINKLVSFVCTMYATTIPSVVRGGCNYYNFNDEILSVENNSIISCLHEIRHHLQETKGLCYKFTDGSLFNVEEDARAFSMRAFKLACPNMFIKAVKEDKVLFLKWDEELNKIVNNS